MNLMTENNIDPIDPDAVDIIEEDAVDIIDAVAEVEVDAVESKPAPVQAEAKVKPAPTAPASIESSEPKTQVILAAIQQNPIRGRYSTSVDELQRRLASLGFNTVIADKPGILGTGTRVAITQYQEKNRLAVTDAIDAATLKSIFKGESTVEVHA